MRKPVLATRKLYDDYGYFRYRINYLGQGKNHAGLNFYQFEICQIEAGCSKHIPDSSFIATSVSICDDEPYIGNIQFGSSSYFVNNDKDGSIKEYFEKELMDYYTSLKKTL